MLSIFSSLYSISIIHALTLFSVTEILSTDSVSKTFVPGRIEETYMITEKAYLPVFKRTFIKKFEAFETRGTWEVQGDFMGGPFINYLVKDSINKRTLYIEGFVFSPSQRKRDNIIELEAIIKTLKIFEKN